MALLNARDVFARRPECVSLWVIHADRIFSRTRQELENWLPEIHPSAEPVKPYQIFCKLKSNGTAIWVGEVQATSPQFALAAALNVFSNNPQPYTWWICPDSAILRSTTNDLEPFFTPAKDKPFRDSSYYHVITTMRKVRKG
jgi:ring-1,2-phenylacetyl-CoA epoxidase subunit PaaB